MATLGSATAATFCRSIGSGSGSVFKHFPCRYSCRRVGSSRICLPRQVTRGFRQGRGRGSTLSSYEGIFICRSVCTKGQNIHKKETAHVSNEVSATTREKSRLATEQKKPSAAGVKDHKDGTPGPGEGAPLNTITRQVRSRSPVHLHIGESPGHDPSLGEPALFSSISYCIDCGIDRKSEASVNDTTGKPPDPTCQEKFGRCGELWTSSACMISNLPSRCPISACSGGQKGALD